MKEKYLIILLFLGIHCFPQTTPDTTIFSDWNESAGFYLLKSNTTLSFQEALLKVKNYYGLNSNSSFVEYNSKIDSSGTIHKKYQHTYNSIPVYGSKIYVHGNANGKAASLNGYIINRLNTTAVQAISSENAINIAINESRASQFFWQDVNYENALKEDMNNQSATYYPSPELLYFPLNNDKKAEYTLCYKLLLCSIEPYKKEYYFIDASNGNVLHKQSAFEACHSENPNQSTKNTASCSGECIGGQTNTLFYGAQYVNIGKKTFGIDCKYRLRDACYNTVIHTRSKSATSYNSGSPPNYEFTDQSTYFNFNPTTYGGTAHWGAEMTTEYYRGVFGREGMDGAAYPVYTYLNENSLGNSNAFYDQSNNSLNFGSGNDNLAHNHIVAVDIIGHEFTHGVTRYEADFYAYGESGALNEGFSDIFGTMVEYYAKYWHSTTSPFNYSYGAENYYNVTYTIPNGPSIYPTRDMSFPNNSLLPDTYNGTYWLNPNDQNVDKGGRHVNCAVLDYWFYLLAEGGNGQNDLQNNFCVIGIGKNKAMRIAYHTLNYYMSTYSDFNAARYATIQSASALYGNTSVELAQVIAAWYAVGVGGNPTTSLPFYINVDSKVETVNTNYNYNSKLRFDSYTVTPNTSVDISSNKEIQFAFTHFNGQYSATLADIHFKQGSEIHAYIAPANCIGGARFSSSPSNSNTNALQNGTTLEDINKIASTKDNTLIFPNPSSGVYTLFLNDTKETPLYISIKDYLGKEVKRFNKPSTYELTFNISELNNGIYFVNIQYEGERISKKISKQ